MPEARASGVIGTPLSRSAWAPRPTGRRSPVRRLLAVLATRTSHRALPPVPEPALGRAVLPGLESVRARTDHPTPAVLGRLSAALATPLPGQDGVHALVLSGGGPKGAFAAGALVALSDGGRRPPYSVVTGVSAGALIAPFAFLGADHDATLRHLHLDQRTGDILRRRPVLDWIRGESFADTGPLQRLLREVIASPVVDALAAAHERGRVLLVNTVDLDAQHSVVWDLTAVAASGHPERAAILRTVILAAMSFPGVFPPVFVPVEVDGQPHAELHMDGGLTDTLLVDILVRAASQAGAGTGAAGSLRIDLILNRGLEPLWMPVEPRLVPLAQRSLDTIMKAKTNTALARLAESALPSRVAIHMLTMPQDAMFDLDDPWQPALVRRLFETGQTVAAHPDAWQSLR